MDQYFGGVWGLLLQGEQTYLKKYTKRTRFLKLADERII
jgi:hypothetical protein